MTEKNYHLETLAIHAGQTVDSDTLARNVPVYRTTAYVFKSSEHGANLFALKELGNIYARLMNPTNDVLEKRIAALEGGLAGLSLSSGTAAVYFSIVNILKTGDELVSAVNLYGGTYTMFDAILPQQCNITVRFAPVNDFEKTEAAITPKTRAIFVETIGNPVLDVADLEGYAKIAKKHKLPLLVDSTFTPPFLLRPIDYGADVVIHSLTKWIGGHGLGIGGIVVDAGKFDWKDPRFDLYNEPDRGYHGLRFGHDLGPLSPIAFALRLRTVGLRNQGPTLAPDAAWLFLQAVESLALRIGRHSENALKVAQWLEAHPKVTWVRYPGLPKDPAYKLAQKYLPNGQGGMVVFGVKGGRDAGIKLVDNIKLFSILANVGDAKSLIIHSASTTHSQLSGDAQAAGGLHDDLIRLSIGIEHIDDIIGALDDALKLI
ncbi:MAG: O-acetylhomoserine aminocarboxypropyltransferase/cysteine synthase [Deltaproteobacteria bacterium]|jgi:O-acetylhomoserine (thiol)-lyase|nr:O-acetylhomoserine aminocarboxypropyltransferase/cysteine synthase [Deltaproteobacteria bacterium]